MRCVVFRGVGGREVMAIEDRPDPVPSAFEVVIAPRVFGRQPRRRAATRGRVTRCRRALPLMFPGSRWQARVAACGSAVTAFAVGDRAFGLVGGGGHATLVVGQERELAEGPRRTGR